MNTIPPTSVTRHRPLGPTKSLRVVVVAALSMLTFVGISTVDNQPVEAGSRFFAGSNPQRLKDTRTAPGAYQDGALADGRVLRVNVGSAKPAVINLSAVSPTGPGFLTAYPCGTRRPNASVLNFSAAVTSNLAIVKPDSKGMVCLFARVAGGGSVHVIVDKYGALNGSAFKAAAAKRRIDTRPSGERVQPGEERWISDIRPHSSLVVNLAVTKPTAAGWLAAYPCSEGFPGTANLNFTRGETRSALAVARADSSGRVCIRSSAPAHVIADVMGAFASSPAADIVTPSRVMDSREGLAGQYGQSFELDFDVIAPKQGGVLKGRGRAVMLNIAAVAPGTPGHVVVWPCAKRRPTTSALNFSVGRYATSNPVVIQPDQKGKVCMWSSSPIHLVVDLGGYLNRSAPGSSVSYEPRTDCARGSIDFINNERSRLGRAELAWDENQFRYACAWAHRMSTDDKLYHWGWGVPYPFGGENIAVGATIGMLENAWIASPPHHDNVIGVGYHKTAVAYVGGVTHGNWVQWGVNQYSG